MGANPFLFGIDKIPMQRGLVEAEFALHLFCQFGGGKNAKRPAELPQRFPFVYKIAQFLFSNGCFTDVNSQQSGFSV